MMSDPIVRVQADMPDAVVRIEVANQGKDGYTPQRGVDYWTKEDVQEIHDYVDEQIEANPCAVSSVNGKTGAVVLAPEDIGAQPKGDYALKKELPSVPTRLSQLEQDANHRLATDAEKAAWNAKSDFSGKYADLEGKPAIPLIDDAAVSAESTWSSKHTVERFLPEFSESGAAVECHPFPLCPLNVFTTFEPAQAGSGDPAPDNIRPISGYDKLSLTRCGRNLLQTKDHNANAHGLKWECTDGLWHVYGTVDSVYPRCQMPIPLILPTGSYICIPQFVSGSLSDVSGRVACMTSDITKYIFNIPTEIFERTRFDLIIFGNIPIGTTVDVKFYLMVVLASETDMTYEPYRGDTYIAHLGDTVYGGTYDWSKGELMAEWKMMPLDGTEAWSVNLSNQNGSPNRFHLTLTGYEVGNHQVIADRYKTVKWSAHGSNVNSVVLYRDAAWETTKLSIASDLNEAEFKAYLAEQYAAGTPVQIAYKLAAPIAIQLSPLEIMPLEGMNVLSSNPGNTTVSGKFDPIYLHEQNKTAAAKLAGMETRLQALESAAVNNA